MSETNRTTGGVILPSRMHVLRGTREAPEQYHLYFSNIVRGMRASWFPEVQAPRGMQYGDFWRFEPGSREDGEADGFTLGLQVRDEDFHIVRQGQTQILLVDRTAHAPCRLLCIGDSITRGGWYVQHVQEVLPGVKSVGTRTYDNGGVCTEGRGGWSVRDYFSAGRPGGSDSPFMFPQGIPGRKYRGNTAFWRHVTGPDGTAYDYEGFQKAGRNWMDENAPWCFDSRGYPLEPAEGDVVFEPDDETAAPGFLQWQGTAWVRMEDQPAWTFSFEDYMARFSYAYEEAGEVRGPDVVSILLGANDFQKTEGVEEGLSGYLEGISTMIRSVQAWRKETRCIVCLPVAGTHQDAWGINTGCTGTAARYLRNMQAVGQAILDRWDHPEAEAQGVYVCPMLAGLDTAGGFETRTERASKYSEVMVERYTNWVHPNLCGHRQMGDVLAAVVQHIRNEAQ